MVEIVVADAGPLIALGRLNRIALLPGIFTQVIVPQAVFEETQFHPDLSDARAIFTSRQRGEFIVAVASAGPGALPPDDDLGAGEAAAISLAVERGHGVLIDDMHGRTVASTLKLKVIGTVGVLVLARQRGLIPRLKPLLENLVASGHHLSEALVQEALRRVGE